MIALRIVSAVTPYNRGGLHFPMIAGRRHCVIVKPIDDFTDIQLEQLLADPNLDVVPIQDGDAAIAAHAVPTETIAMVDRVGRLRGSGDSAAAERDAFAAQYYASLDVRAAELDARQAALEIREEEHRRATTTVLHSVDGFDTRTVAGGDVAVAGLPPRVLADVVERNRDEAVDHHGAANTPAQHLADEVEAGLVEVVDEPIDEAGLGVDELVDAAPLKPKRSNGRFARTTTE